MIVVTAPTSNIGRQLVQRLLAADAKIRVVARDPARLGVEVRERAEIVTGSHSELDVVRKAFEGADAIFWLTPADEKAADVMAAYLDFSRPACRVFKNQRVVGITALGRGTPVEKTAGHVTASLAMDDLIASTGVDYRALAMPSFMDNLAGQAGSIENDGVFYGPTSPGLTAPAVATRDIAAVAARWLLDDTWSGVEEVPVLGPEDLSPDDMARTMTEVLGWSVRYQQIPGEAFKGVMIQAGLSEAMAQAMLDMMVAKDKGLDNGVRRTAQTSTPTSFGQWCEEVLRPTLSRTAGR